MTFAKSDSSASYAVCKADCSAPYNAVIIKGVSYESAIVVT